MSALLDWAWRIEQIIRVPKNRFAAALSLLAPLIIMTTAACDGNGDTRPAPQTINTITIASERSEYISDIRDLTANADSINSDYRNLLDRYDNGSVTVEDVIGFAEEAAGEFDFMSGRLDEMNVPEEFLSEHQQLDSAFGKWQQFYQLQIEGLNNNDADVLNQARDLDSQAAIETNEAIEGINQKLT